jgi:hypothetical protein
MFKHKAKKIELKEYLQYVFSQYTSHKFEQTRYNMLTNQQMEINQAIRKELLTA